MMLMERMILLLLEASADHGMAEANLLSVCLVIKKRYGLLMENSLSRFDAVLNGLTVTYVDRGSTGYRLNDGGMAELRDIHRRQDVFCSRFSKIAASIFNRTIASRSYQTHAHV